jgi:hypothetical protein
MLRQKIIASLNIEHNPIPTTDTANSIADLVVKVTLTNNHRRECTAIALGTQQVKCAAMGAADSGE